MTTYRFIDEFTPGPWFECAAAGGWTGIVAQDKNDPVIIADCVYRRADRRLIIAAPDMLATLEAVARWWTKGECLGASTDDVMAAVLAMVEQVKKVKP